MPCLSKRWDQFAPTFFWGYPIDVCRDRQTRHDSISVDFGRGIYIMEGLVCTFYCLARFVNYYISPREMFKGNPVALLLVVYQDRYKTTKSELSVQMFSSSENPANLKFAEFTRLSCELDLLTL